MRYVVALSMVLAAVPAAASPPTFDEPPTQPARLVATRPVASGGAAARLLVPVACATPTFDVEVSPYDAFLEMFWVGIHADYPPEPDCQTLERLVPMTVPLGALPGPGVYFFFLMSNKCPPLFPDSSAGTCDQIDAMVVDAATCVGLCMHGGRFSVEGQWSTGAATGDAQPLPLTEESGALWFFDPQNLEVVVKVLDACGINDHYWLFASGLTDVGVTLQVHDNSTGQTRTYTNPPGHVFTPILDTRALPCSAASSRIVGSSDAGGRSR